MSQERVKHWTNTVAGHRRQKLKAREERLAAEDAERAKRNEEDNKELAERRQQAIAKARETQYHQLDNVREFHSRVLLYSVLQVQLLHLFLNLVPIESRNVICKWP